MLNVIKINFLNIFIMTDMVTPGCQLGAPLYLIPVSGEDNDQWSPPGTMGPVLSDPWTWGQLAPSSFTSMRVI